MAKRVRPLTVLNDTGLFHASLNAVPLPVCGRGILGARARDVAYRTKQERFILHRIQVVEERRVRVHRAKSDVATLECKLYVSYLINAFDKGLWSSVESVPIFSHGVICFPAHFSSRALVGLRSTIENRREQITRSC